MVTNALELGITLWSDTQKADALLARIYALDPEAQVTALQGQFQFHLRLSRGDNALASRLASLLRKEIDTVVYAYHWYGLDA